MRPVAKPFILLFGTLALSACTQVEQGMRRALDVNSLFEGAEPITWEGKDLSSAISDSISKCNTYVDLIFGGQRGVSTGLAITTTALAALTTALAPAGAATAAGLGAATAIVSGTNTGLTNNYFLGIGPDTFARVMRRIYYDKMTEFSARQTSRPAAQPWTVGERAELDLIHANCRLSMVRAQISQSVETPAAAPKTGATTTPAASQ